MNTKDFVLQGKNFLSFFDDEIFFFLDEHCGTQRQTLSDDRRDRHIDLFRRFFLFFVGRERDESVLDMSLSLLCSLYYRTTRFNHVVISSRETRKTHYYYYYYYYYS